MNKVQDRKAYRIEERYKGNDGAYRMTWGVDYDSRDEARKEFAKSVALLASGEIYEPDARFRLVLLGPDRTTLPGGAR